VLIKLLKTLSNHQTNISYTCKKERKRSIRLYDDDDDEEELPKKEINPESPKDG
jgi:hypothetical protein